MIYTVLIREKYDDEKGKGVTLTYYTLEDVINLVGLITAGQKEYHYIEIKITAEPRKDLEKDEEH